MKNWKLMKTLFLTLLAVASVGACRVQAQEIGGVREATA